MESNYATPQELQERLLKEDIPSLIKKLEAYAHSRIKGMGLSVEAFDVVHDVLLSIQEGSNGRKWNKSTCPSFDSFLFGAVMSHINNLYKKHKNSNKAITGYSTIYQPPSIEMNVFDEIDFNGIILETINYMRELGSDEVEEKVFKCWCDGINKPQEVAEFLQISVKTVNNATKRLKRKQPLIQERLNYHQP